MAFLVLAWVLMPVAPLRGQATLPGANKPPVSADAPARLPGTTEEIDRALTQIETRLAKAREQAAGDAPEATPDELAQRQRLFQQWVLALEAQSSSLRRLKEIRQFNQDRAAEAGSWNGFSQKPPYPLEIVEGLRDAVAAQRLDAQTDQMMLSISVNDVERDAVLLEQNRRTVRLARDQAESGPVPSQRQQWLVWLAEARERSNEAMLEASATRRLVMLEALSGINPYIEFLERKLVAAAAQGRFTQGDLDGVLARLNEKREALRGDINDAIIQDARLRRDLAAARENLRLAQMESAATPAARLRDLRARVEAGQEQADTSELKLNLLRAFVVLIDYGDGIWKDRFWATGDHTLAELRNKQQAHRDNLAGLHPWKQLVELKLSGIAAEALGASVWLSGTNSTPVEREAAVQVRAALEERAVLYQRALSAITLVDNLSERLMAELAQRQEQVTAAGKARFVLGAIGSFCVRVWNTELYIAENSVIADGQKISVPRIITLGKVLVALGIFLAGVMVAHWGRGVVERAATGWFRAEERTAGLAAKFAAGMIALIALFVAMATVRIPWTVFAFLGGALAIGVGFGAQTLINNFISGIILLFERSIRVGDIVEVDDQRGTVVSFGFRTSLLERGDSVEVLVPNSQFLEKKVVNWTLKDDLVQYKIRVGVAGGSSPAKVSALVARAATDHPAVMKDPAPIVLFEDFGDNALVFALAFWMRLQSDVDGDVVRSDLRYRIHALLNEGGIALAFAQRDVHLDSARPLEVKLVNSPATVSPGGAPPTTARP